ncbi:MAG: YCF48-related protein [Nitrosomonadaceae bacterium]|nr:YCF48-related protein [Nitrosomonadaceae bacterium]
MNTLSSVQSRRWLASLLGAIAFGLAVGAHAQINPKVMPASGAMSKQAMSRLMLTDIVRSGNRIVAVGDRGYVVYSDSNGETWSRAKTPAGVPLLTSVQFSSGDTLWATGHDSTILKSVNNGQEWTQAYASEKDKRPLMDVLFIDANVGYAVGAYGAFYETTDGGKTWAARKAISSPSKPPARKAGKARAESFEDEPEKTDEDRHLNSIIKLSDGRLLIVGEAGTMMVSADAGKSWSRLNSPYKGSFFGAVQANNGAVIVYGLRGNVYRSTDGMRSWSQLALGTKASFMGSTKLADGAIVLAGLSGTLLISRDNGQSFTALNSGTIKPLSGAVFGGSNDILVIGETGPRTVLLSASSTAAASGAATAPAATPANPPSKTAKP